MPGGKMNESR